MSHEWQQIADDGFIGLIGPIWHAPFDNGVGRFRFTAAAKHRNRSGNVHGGMLMAFADRAMGMTARQHNLSRRQSTVQFDMQFIRPVRIGSTVELECRIVTETRSLAFMDGIMTVDEFTVATARGVWKILGAE